MPGPLGFNTQGMNERLLKISVLKSGPSFHKCEKNFSGREGSKLSTPVHLRVEVEQFHAVPHKRFLSMDEGVIIIIIITNHNGRGHGHGHGCGCGRGRGHGHGHQIITSGQSIPYQLLL